MAKQMKQVYTGISVRGPGNNVSAVSCGVNAGEGRMIAVVGKRINNAWAQRRKMRQINNSAK